MSSTAEFVDEKIQLFHSQYGPNHCFNCVPEAPYQFFSGDVNSMVKYSSNWSRENREGNVNCKEDDLICKEIIDEENNSPKINWYLEDTSTLTDIGFSENVPLFSIYKCRKPIKKTDKYVDHVDHDVTLLPLLNWKLPIRKQSPTIQATTLQKFKTKRKKEINETLPPFHTLLKKNKGEVHSFPYHFVTKLATSRFGRTRKVIDFTVFEDETL